MGRYAKSAAPSASVSHELGDLRNLAHELAAYKRIDAYAYSKARYKASAAKTPAEVRAIIDWLNEQPEWTETEMQYPEYVREEMRDSEMLERECALYWKKQSERNGNKRGSNDSKGPSPGQAASAA